MFNRVFVCLCGIQGSGKSTISKVISKALNIKRYECDEFFERNKGKKTYETIRLFHQQIRDDLIAGNDVIVDGTYTIKRTRSELLNAVKGIDCKRILIYMGTPLEECIRRNSQRPNPLPDFMIRDIYNSLEFPTLDEGWDEIIEYTD